MGLMKDIAMDIRENSKGGGSAAFVRMKSMFFDRESVRKMMRDDTRKRLNFFGALCRKIAMNSIKSGDKISQPGSPPTSHVGANNRRIRAASKAAGVAPPKMHRGIKEIYYAFDPNSQSVVIGPIAFNSSQLAGTHTRVDDHITTLELLEYGGVALRKARTYLTNAAGHVYPNPRANEMIQCTYRPRPFMGPAFRVATEQAIKRGNVWAGGVK